MVNNIAVTNHSAKFNTCAWINDASLTNIVAITKGALTDKCK